MKLSKHIETNHKSNQSEFARSQGVKPFQVKRWLDRGCEWLNGAVWCPVSKHKVDKQ